MSRLADFFRPHRLALPRLRMSRLACPGFFAGLVAALLLTACGGTPESESVALVAGQPISAEEYRTRYMDFLLSSGLPDQGIHRAAYLEQLITLKLMARDAVEGGLAEEPVYRFAEERARQKLLIDAWAHRAVYDTIAVSEEDLADMFVRAHTTVTARHLYAPTREAADTLYERLRRGASFEELAQEVFADTALARSGGRLGSFGFDEMDPAFEEVAFTLPPGDFSQPVRTAQGYSIIQVEDRFTKPILTETEFAAQKNKMRSYVLDRERRRARTALSASFREDAAPSYHGPAFDSLLTRITDAADRPEDAATPAPDSESSVWLDDPLVTFGPPRDRQTWTVSEFRERARFTDPRQRGRVRDAEMLRRFIDGLIVQEMLLEAARRARVDRTPEFARALDRAMEDWAFEQAWDRLARDVSVPEDSIRAWYEAHDEPSTPPSIVQARLHETMMDEALRAHADDLRTQYEVKIYPEIVSGLRILDSAP